MIIDEMDERGNNLSSNTVASLQWERMQIDERRKARFMGMSSLQAMMYSANKYFLVIML